MFTRGKQKKLKIDSEHRRCYICGEIFHNSQIILNRHCEGCREKNNKLKYQQDFIRRMDGSGRVKPKPYTYNDDQEKEDVEMYLTALGYTKNEQTGEWYKEPWKLADGTFPLIKDIVTRNKEREKIRVKKEKYQGQLKNRLVYKNERQQLINSLSPIFEKLNIYIANKNRAQIKTTVILLRDMGLKYAEIARKLDAPISRVFNYANFELKK